MTHRNLCAALCCLVGAACSTTGPPPSWEDVSPHDSRFFRVNGLRLQVLDWGGSGPHLVLVGGSDGSPHHFDDLARRLTGRFRVIAPARRGHGQSDAAAEPWDVDVLADQPR